MPKAKSTRKTGSARRGKSVGKQSTDELEVTVEATTSSDTSSGKHTKMAKPYEATEDKQSTKKISGKRSPPKPSAKKAPLDIPEKSTSVTPEEDFTDDDDDAEWEVERILDVRNLRSGKKEFWVKWKGFPNSKATWEPEENLTSCEELLTAFMASVEKEDLSRSRRLSTTYSTKSSRNLKQGKGSKSTESVKRMKTGRISKSKTQSKGQTTGADKETRRSNTKDDINDGNLNADDLMQQIINPAKYKPEHSSRFREPYSEIKRTSEIQKLRAAVPKRSWSLLGKSLGYCGAAVATLGVGLGTWLYASPDLVTWLEYQPKIENVVNILREHFPSNNGPQM